MSNPYLQIGKDPFFYPPAHSTVKAKGNFVTEIITMIGGYNKTFAGVDTNSFMKGEFTHFNTRDGRKVMVRTENVLFIEVFTEGEK